MKTLRIMTSFRKCHIHSKKIIVCPKDNDENPKNHVGRE